MYKKQHTKLSHTCFHFYINIQNLLSWLKYALRYVKSQNWLPYEKSLHLLVARWHFQVISGKGFSKPFQTTHSTTVASTQLFGGWELKYTVLLTITSTHDVQVDELSLDVLCYYLIKFSLKKKNTTTVFSFKLLFNHLLLTKTQES